MSAGQPSFLAIPTPGTWRTACCGHRADRQQHASIAGFAQSAPVVSGRGRIDLHCHSVGSGLLRIGRVSSYGSRERQPAGRMADDGETGLSIAANIRRHLLLVHANLL
jgi:hypothetical protein